VRAEKKFLDKGDFMKYKTFSLPCHICEGEQLEEMDKFIATHNIANVEKHFYQAADGTACWAFCISYLEHGAARFTPSDNYANFKAKTEEKKDYSKILTEEQYKKFEAFKEIRKKLVADSTKPAYTIFTDYELSEIAKLENPDEKSVIAIKGISKNKAEKFGKLLLEKYAASVSLTSAPLNDRAVQNLNAEKTQIRSLSGAEETAQTELF
jgi:superfamily II DNA helicase RecQ